MQTSFPSSPSQLAVEEPAVPTKPPTVGKNWLEDKWLKFIEGTSLHPDDDGRRRTIFGYLNDIEDDPDLPLLPGGDPDDDAELPYFTANQFVNTTWTVGLLYDGPLKSVRRRRVVFGENGKVLWDKGPFGISEGGAWKYDSRTNVMKFSLKTLATLNGRRIFPTLLAKEENLYYMEGYIIGWAPYTPLTCWGLWQAYRDDVDPEVRGPAPWDDQKLDDENDNRIIEG